MSLFKSIPLKLYCIVFMTVPMVSEFGTKTTLNILSLNKSDKSCPVDLEYSGRVGQES